MRTKVPHLYKVSACEAAYAAGFFDGEGAVMIWRRTGSQRDAAGRRYHRLMVSINQVDMRPLQWLIDRFGGTVTAIKPPKDTNYRTCYQWVLSCQRAEAFLQVVRPYVVLKKARIDIALQFQRTIGLNVTTGKKGWTAITPELWQERENCRDALMALNKRGAA